MWDFDDYIEQVEDDSTLFHETMTFVPSKVPLGLTKLVPTELLWYMGRNAGEVDTHAATIQVNYQNDMTWSLW